MKTKVIAQGIVATAFAFAIAAPTLAAGVGWYVGASAGETLFDEACDDISGSCDDTDFGWKAFVGYQATPMWGLELFYTDLGKLSASAAPFKAEMEAQGVGMFATGTWPIGGGFDVFAKFGALNWDVDSKFSDSSIPASTSPDSTGTNLAFGVGARHSFTRNFAVRVEWDRFNDVGDNNTGGEGDLDLITAGVVYSF